jgi:LysR family transcriptional regulator (chromosome initiation inhibitor)
MLDYASLAAVAAVVQEGSFERAARLLNVTPSAISQRIKLLEERVGSVLIVRGQPCTATAAGNLICRHVERVGMLESELRDSLPQLVPADSAGDRITLRVGVNADSLGSWFLAAMAAFTREEAALLDVVVDDEEHTIDGLKNGQVLAAITSHAQSVQGCKSVELGKLRYRAVASPDFVRRYFPDGVTAESLAVTPSLRFNHKDQMQATWIRARLGNDVATPAHWLPSTQAFLDASLAGIGWSMNPEPLVRPHLRAGTLVELIADSPLDVPLYWQHTRLQVPTLERLTRAVSMAARAVLL